MSKLFDNLRKYIAKKDNSEKSLDSYLTHKYSDSYIDVWESTGLFWFLNKGNPFVKNLLKKTFGLDYDLNNIDRLIKNFTLAPYNRGQNYEDIKEVVSDLCWDYLEKIEDINNGIRFQTKDGKIAVVKLTEVINVDAVTKCRLLSNERHDYCHHGSIWLSSRMEDGSCDLVTAKVGASGKPFKYLHSWVETDIAGQPVCFDYTKNAMINKEGYYRLMAVDENSLSRIPNEVIKQDTEKFDRLYNHNPWFTKLYLDNREEAMEWYDRIFIDDKEVEKEA